MSKVAKGIAIVAGIVAVVATAGGALMGAAAFASTFGVAASTVAGIASAVSTVASLAATMLQKKPGARGSVSQTVIGATMPIPYGMGRTYGGGMMVYDNSAGGSKNEWRFQIMALSAAGPIDSIENFYADYAAVPLSVSGAAQGWYNGFMDVELKLGLRPETAHASANTAMPGWTTDHKMSGYASYRVKMKFDKDAKRFASGVPQMGCVAKMVKVYDPRLDGTYPGGSGAHRWDDESTWSWSENPALHALTYARGRFIEKTAAGAPLVPPVRLLGAGLPKTAIDIASFVEMANLNDTNVWKIGGFVYEGPDISKWDNLKRIMQAGGARPVWSGGQLRALTFAPRATLFTITTDDLAPGPVDVKAMKGWRDRHNSCVARYRSEQHKWEYVQNAAVTVPTYLDEDGELKTLEVQYDLVQHKDQSAQLAAYELVNEREFGPITLTVKPRLLTYLIGESGIVHIPEAGLNNQKVIILGRSIDPATGAISLTMESETDSKHAYALGRSGVAPPTPTIRTSQEMDESVAPEAISETTQLILNSWTEGLTATVDNSGNVTVSDHVRVYADKRVNVTGAYVLASGDPGEYIAVYYNDPDRVGGAVTYGSRVPPENAGDAFASPSYPYSHFIAAVTVPMAGEPAQEAETASPPSWPGTAPSWKTGDLDGFFQ